MRKLLVAACLLGVSITAGCKAKDSAPASPEGTPAAATTAGTPATPSPSSPPAAVAPPAYVIYSGNVDGRRTVGATIEDGSAPPTALSIAGVDTTFAGVLEEPSRRRALLVEYKADASIDAVNAVRGDGEGRTLLGTLPAGMYAGFKQVRSVDGAVVAEATRAGTTAATDVLALRPGVAPRVIAADSTLVAAAAGRVAVMTAGNLRSMLLDGSAVVPLGGRDGHDQVAEVKDQRILLTIHAGASGDVRTIGIDGSGAVDVGKAAVDESAFAFATPTSPRVVYVRKGDGGQSLVSAALAGNDERILTTATSDLRPVRVTTDGQVIFTAASAMHAVDVNGGGAARILDPSIGTNVQIGIVQDGVVVYRSDSPNGPALRAVRLDGTHRASLCEELRQNPFFAGLTSTGRVVYYRALTGSLEGGRLFSVKLDGSDVRAIGTGVAGADGKPLVVADQDFEARTPSGRLILESEFVSEAGSQLVVASHDTDSAKLLLGTSHVRFVALIP